jgi:hypothetical protein
VAVRVVEATSEHAPQAPGKDLRARRRHPATALLLLAAVLFAGYGLRTVGAPFGDSHDGRNAGVWAAGSRSLREAGPWASRLGTRSPETGVYANHPPLIYVETALAEVVGLGTRAATRAPAWLGSLLLLVLLATLLRDRGLRAGAVGIAVLLAATTPMFLVYGTMLDTPVTSLPFGVGLLVLWERARRGDRVRPLWAGVVTALAVLAGWQGVLLASLVGTWALVRVLRRSGGRADLGFAAGAGAGAGLLLAWLLWAFGGTLRPLLDQFLFRAGRSTQQVSVATLLAVERGDVMVMFGAVALLAVAGLVAAFRNPRTRGLAAVALAVTVPYPFLFRTGAVHHDYWGYWFLLPVAVGLAAGADAFLARWGARARSEAVPVVAVTVLAMGLFVATLAMPPYAEWTKVRGFVAGRALEGAALPEDQQVALYAGALGEPATWVGLATGRQAVLVPASRYESVAAERPADLVFVGEVRCVAGEDHRSYELRPAATLADRPPVIRPCRADRLPQPDGPAGR